MLPLAIELMSGLMYGLIAFMLSHVGSEVEPGDITLLLKCFASASGSGLMTGRPGVPEPPRPPAAGPPAPPTPLASFGFCAWGGCC
uniref:Putative secreted protein n=1 Tax=Anopheles triannulatus TaxID=58253 RepID=A0A2M4B2E3_9DIPT